MLSIRTLFAIALLPFLATSLSAQTTQKMNSTQAARAECFRQANEAARAQVGMASANPAAAVEGNSVGVNAYYSCLRRAGIRR
jgi:hypothetical protein